MNNKEMYIKSGKRIKEMLKKKGIKQKELLEVLNIEHPTLLSNKLAGEHKHLSEYDYEQLAKFFGNGTRIDYLKCIDDFETDDDFFENSQKGYSAIIEYLKTLGLILSPAYYWNCTEYHIYKYYSKMKEYITESDRKEIELSRINFNLTDNEAKRKYDKESMEYEFRLKNYPANDLLKIDDLTKNKPNDNYYKIIHGAGDSWIVLRYKATYNDNEYIISMDRITNLFNYIDAMNKASIEALIKQRSIFDSEFN